MTLIDGASFYFHNRHADGGNCRVVEGMNMFRIGRKPAGHLLDGVAHREIPSALRVGGE